METASFHHLKSCVQIFKFIDQPSNQSGSHFFRIVTSRGRKGAKEKKLNFVRTLPWHCQDGAWDAYCSLNMDDRIRQQKDFPELE
jgi:hypothetical protein